MPHHTVSLPDGSCFRAGGDENLLAAAQRAHWLVRYGCRNGNCEACAATLHSGQVVQQGIAITGGNTRILLCLCQARSDLVLELPDSPQHGSEAQARRCYARLDACEASTDGNWTLRLTPAAGRQPPLHPGQYLLLEQDTVPLRAELVACHDRVLEAIAPAAPEISAGGYAYIRYPLGFCYSPDPARPALVLHQPLRSTQAKCLASSLSGARRVELSAGITPDLAAEIPSLVLACTDSVGTAFAWYESLLAAGAAFDEFRCDEAVWYRWQVCRQDDNGVRFTVAMGLSERRARALTAEFEARGHKQLYWAEPMFHHG